MLIAGEFESLVRANQFDSIERLFADDLGERLDKPGLASWRQRRRVTVRDQGAQISFFVKRFEHPPSSARRLVRIARNGARSVAGVEWSWMHRLRQDGIACAQAVALGEEMIGGKEVRSVLVSKAAAGQSLERWMQTWNEIPPSRRREVLLGVARLVSKLHGKGYIHRDLYLSHVFYDPQKTGDEALCLIDLQRVIQPRWRQVRWIVKDLASLNFSTPAVRVSHQDRLRWLLVYLGNTKLDGAGRRLVYRIIGKTMRIARKESRRMEQRKG